jgi:hypothetical protein
VSPGRFINTNQWFGLHAWNKWHTFVWKPLSWRLEVYGEMGVWVWHYGIWVIRRAS